MTTAMMTFDTADALAASMTEEMQMAFVEDFAQNSRLTYGTSGVDGSTLVTVTGRVNVKTQTLQGLVRQILSHRSGIEARRANRELQNEETS